MKINPINLASFNVSRNDQYKKQNSFLTRQNSLQDSFEKTVSFKGFNTVFESIYYNFPQTEAAQQEMFKKIIKTALVEPSFKIKNALLLWESLDSSKPFSHIVNSLRNNKIEKATLIADSNDRPVVSFGLIGYYLGDIPFIKFNNTDVSHDRNITFRSGESADVFCYLQDEVELKKLHKEQEKRNQEWNDLIKGIDLRIEDDLYDPTPFFG